MTAVKSGDKVKVHYTGRLHDGTVFDTSAEGEPLEFQLGAGEIIPGFEQAVLGMSPGDAKKVDIPVEAAYGPRNEAMVIEVERGQFPTEFEPEVGQQFQLPQQNGQMTIVTVTAVSDGSVTLDGNHPLAGEHLAFEIELVEVL